MDCYENLEDNVERQADDESLTCEVSETTLRVPSRLPGLFDILN